MNYKIICDSCCDIPSEMYADPHFSFIPLTLYVGDNIIVDDETFDQASFLKLVDETETASRSACPSAGEYMESYEKSDEYRRARKKEYPCHKFHVRLVGRGNDCHKA